MSDSKLQSDAPTRFFRSRLGCAIILAVATAALTLAFVCVKMGLRYRARKGQPASVVAQLEAAHNEPVYFPEDWRNPPPLDLKLLTEFAELNAIPHASDACYFFRAESEINSLLVHLIAGKSLGADEITSISGTATDLLPFVKAYSAFVRKPQYSALINGPRFSRFYRYDYDQWQIVLRGEPLFCVAVYEMWRNNYQAAFEYTIADLASQRTSEPGILLGYSYEYLTGTMYFVAMQLAYLADHCPQVSALQEALMDLNKMRSSFQLPSTSVTISALPFLHDLQFARSIGFQTEMRSGGTVTGYLSEAANMQANLSRWLSDRTPTHSYLHTVMVAEFEEWEKSAGFGMTNKMGMLFEATMNPDGILIKLVERSAANPRESEIRFFCLYDLARIALAARIYKLEKGHSAASVGQLVGPYLTEEPLDPYSKKSFLYDSGHDKFYSVGLNGRDDHGQNSDYGVGVGDDIKALPERQVAP